MIKKLLLFLVVVFAFFQIVVPVIAIDCEGNPPSCNQGDTGCTEQLSQYIAACNAKISSLKAQQQTLKAALNLLTSKINLTTAQIKSTTAQIESTQKEIDTLSETIVGLNVNLDQLTKVFVSRVRELYKTRETNVAVLFFASDSYTSFQNRLKYLNNAQRRDQLIIKEMEAARLNFDKQKSAKEQKQQEMEALQLTLESQKKVLGAQSTQKNQLLSQTQNSEAQYQSLRSAALNQLAALSNYAKSVGIQLVPHQDLSDSWGKFMSQRDELWGNFLINGQDNGCGGACSIASVGCLITSYSMVVSHYGGSITPAEVAANPENFQVSTAYFNLPGPAANGHSATALSNPSIQDLKDALNSGKVVIAGLSRNGGPYPQHYSDHWVVLRSVDGDSFKINDPLYAGAMNVSLNDHYSGWAIIQARVYN